MIDNPHIKEFTHNKKTEVVTGYLSLLPTIAWHSDLRSISHQENIKKVAEASLETITPGISGVTTHLSHKLPMSSSSKLQIKLNIKGGFLDIPASNNIL